MYLIPNSLAPVLVSATLGVAGAILTEAGLSFLGFGVPPPQASWGNILSDGKQYLFDAPWLTLIPRFSILVLMLSFNLFGEPGIKDFFFTKVIQELGKIELDDDITEELPHVDELN